MRLECGVDFGIEKYKGCLREVLKCEKYLREHPGHVFQNTEGHFLVGPVRDPHNPTKDEVLGAINLSLNLRNANWSDFQIHVTPKQFGLATLVSLANKRDHSVLTTGNIPLTVSTSNPRQSVDTLAVSRNVGPDPRQLTEAEVASMQYYNSPNYSKVNAFLRGDSTHRIIYRTDIPGHERVVIEDISRTEVSLLLRKSLQAISGFNKNKLPLGTSKEALELHESLLEKRTDKENQLSDSNVEIVRLLSDVSVGMRAELTSVTNDPMLASGMQSWSYFLAGSPNIQSNKLFRLKMCSGDQRPLIDYYGRGEQGEIAYGPTRYRVKVVEMKSHTHLVTKITAPIIEIEVERVIDDESRPCWFEDALSVAYENHLRHRYKNEHFFCFEGVERPNHALAHHVRAGVNIDHVVDYFKDHAREDLKSYCESLAYDDKEKLKVFMAFSRTGRESENDFRTNPEGYKLELRASAENFKSFVMAREIMEEDEANLWCRVMQDMGNPLFDDGIDKGARDDLAAYDGSLSPGEKQEAKYIHNIVNLAHKLDLPRCFTQEEYRHAVEPYRPIQQEQAGSRSYNDSIAPLVPFSEAAKSHFEEIQTLAQKMIIATGDHMFRWAGGVRERNRERFIPCNQSVLYCLDICKSVILSDKVNVSVKSIIERIDKILLDPVLGPFFQKLSVLGVNDFPSNEKEMTTFLVEKLFGAENPIVPVDRQYELFADLSLISYIVEIDEVALSVKKLCIQCYLKNIKSDHELDMLIRLDFVKDNNLIDFIITSVGVRLGHLDKRDYYCLKDILYYECITEETRSKILTNLKGGSYELVDSLDGLVRLLSSDIFTAGDRAQILSLFFEKGNRLSLFASSYQLIPLFCHSKLTNDHRSQILEGFGDDLSKLFTDGSQLLRYLRFNIGATKEQRIKIFNSVQHKLPELITNLDVLAVLLGCDIVTTDQCSQILNSLCGKLLKSQAWEVRDLEKLLNCDKLSDSQRSEILDIVLGDYPNQDAPSRMISNGVGLAKMLTCYKLTQEQRNKIWDAFEPKLSSLITSWTHLEWLIDLGRLEAGQRARVLGVFTEKVPQLIRNTYEFGSVLEIESLTDSELTQIIDCSVEKLNLLKIITSWRDLYGILYGFKRLTTDHVTIILDAIKENFQSLIENQYQLVSFLTCGKLTMKYRKFIFCEILSMENIKSLIENSQEGNPFMVGSLSCVAEELYSSPDVKAPFNKEIIARHLKELIMRYTVDILLGKKYSSGLSFLRDSSCSLEIKRKAAFEMLQTLENPGVTQSPVLQRAKESGRLGEIFQFMKKNEASLKGGASIKLFSRDEVAQIKIMF